MKWSEIMLIDKPVGMTSFDVIRRLRKQYFIDHPDQEDITRRRILDDMQGTTESDEGVVYGNTVSEEAKKVTPQIAKKRRRAPKMGHAGTLDPLASGLMIIGCGPGTKQLTNLIKLDKEYITEILIGESRTTGDQEGDVLESVTEVAVSEEQVRQAVSGLVGNQTLPVSAYSAIKKDGVPMYKRARAAAKVGDLVKDVPWREMVIHEAEVLSIKNTIVYDSENNECQGVLVTVRFKVGSGTYIRSLGEEVGRRLGYPACLYSLRRTEVGEWRVSDAEVLPEAKKD